MDDDKNNNEEKKTGFGCFIVTFLLLIAGLPAAIKGEGPIGTSVIIIVGLVLAYYLAKSLSGWD